MAEKAAIFGGMAFGERYLTFLKMALSAVLFSLLFVFDGMETNMILVGWEL